MKIFKMLASTIILLLVGALLVLSIYKFADKDTFYLGNYGIWIYVILIFFIMLPIILLVLVISVVKYKASLGVTNGLKDPSKKEDIKEDNSNVSRFYMLTELDKKSERLKKFKFDDSLDLEEICEDFRKFAANKLHLYYTIEDIRRWVSSLGVSKIIILQGMSGTGKTSLAYAFGEYVKNPSTIIPIQPMWKERTDLIGYYNEFTKKFNETLLLEKMYEADLRKNIYITVLDEMNIARVEYYFAEFLSLLEIPNTASRKLEVVSDVWKNDPKLFQEGKLVLPTNMYFIGTANNDDSTFAISDKVYDRAMIMNLDNKAEPFECESGDGMPLSQEHLDDLYKKAMSEYKITRRNMKRLKSLDSYMISHFHITFGNRIMKQIKQYLPIYCACGGEEIEALDDVLSRKIFRKLESQNPIYVKNESERLIAFMDELFGEKNMTLCREVIDRIVRNA